MKKIKTVIFANPSSHSDPIFFKHGDEYLFQSDIQNLINLNIISDPVISFHKKLDESLQRTVQQFGIPCHISEQSLPQHRLEEISKSDDSDGYLLLTPYSYLLEMERIAEARDVMENSDIQLVNFKGYSTSSAFCICDKRAINELSKHGEIAITPFVAAKYLREFKGQDAVHELELSIEDLACSFLYMLLYFGDGGILPQSFISNYIEQNENDDIFSRSSHVRYLSKYYSIDNFDAFSESFSKMIQNFQLETLAGQIHLVKRLLPFIPKEKGRFLELGFGLAPIASLLLLNIFKSGYAVEPFIKGCIGCDVVEFISNNISIPGYIDLRETKDCDKALRRLEINNMTIENCNIPKNSIDFIFSKTVFEHVKDVKKTSKVLYDILSEKGCMYHIIDFRDHVDTSTIRFDFLRYDKETWSSINNSTNLWRVNDIISVWEELGFKVTVVERLSRPMALNDIHPCWNDYSSEDLFCYHAILTATK